VSHHQGVPAFQTTSMRRALWRPALSVAASAMGLAAATNRATAEPAPVGTGQAVAEKTDKNSKKPEPKSLNEMVIGLCTRGRHVFLTGTIDDTSAQHVIAQLMHLEQEAPGVPIRLHISSGGGKVQAGLAVHDVMHAISSPVHTICLGHCESMAAVLLSSGAPGHRLAMPNVRVMIHQPRQTSGGGSSNARQLAINASSIERSRNKLALLLSERTGKPLDEILELIEYDHVCDAEEALHLGLIDRIVRQPGDGFMEAPPAAAVAAPEVPVPAPVPASVPVPVVAPEAAAPEVAPKQAGSNIRGG